MAVGSRQTKLTWGTATDNVAVRGYRLYVDGAYYKTIIGRVAYIRTSRGTHSFSVRTVDTSANRSYQVGATIRVSATSCVATIRWYDPVPTLPSGAVTWSLTV